MVLSDFTQDFKTNISLTTSYSKYCFTIEKTIDYGFTKGYQIHSIGCSSRVLRNGVKEALNQIRSKVCILLDELFEKAFHVESMKVLRIVIFHHHHHTIFRLDTTHLIMLDRYMYEIFIQPFPAPQAKNGYFVYLSTILVLFIYLDIVTDSSAVTCTRSLK